MSDPLDEFTLTSMRTPTARGRLRRGVVFGALMLAIGFGVAQYFFPSVLEHPLPLIDGPRGLRVYADPLNGWSLAFPGTWHAEAATQRGRRGDFVESSGIALTNIGHPFPDGADGVGIDPRLVAIRVGYAAGRHFVMYCRTDTKLPLNLKGSNQRRRQPILDASGGEVRVLYKRFSKGGLPLYSISVWIGSRAPSEDIETMEAIVGSINYKPTGDPRYGQADCAEGAPTGW